MRREFPNAEPEWFIPPHLSAAKFGSGLCPWSWRVGRYVEGRLSFVEEFSEEGLTKPKAPSLF